MSKTNNYAVGYLAGYVKGLNAGMDESEQVTILQAAWNLFEEMDCEHIIDLFN